MFFVVHLLYIALTIAIIAIHLKEPTWLSEPYRECNRLLLVLNSAGSLLFGALDPWFLSGFGITVICGLVLLVRDLPEILDLEARK